LLARSRRACGVGVEIGMRFEESGDFGLGFFFFRLGYVVVSRTAFCCIDFFDGLAVFGLRWAIARGFPVLQKYSLPCAISPIHAQPTCIYICRNPRVARNTYIQNSYSQGIPVQYTSRVPPHTHILGYTFWKRPDARFPHSLAPGQLVASSSAIHSCKEER
jgi:hypothetical protein